MLKYENDSSTYERLPVLYNMWLFSFFFIINQSLTNNIIQNKVRNKSQTIQKLSHQKALPQNVHIQYYILFSFPPVFLFLFVFFFLLRWTSSLWILCMCVCGAPLFDSHPSFYMCVLLCTLAQYFRYFFVMYGICQRHIMLTYTFGTF